MGGSVSRNKLREQVEITRMSSKELKKAKASRTDPMDGTVNVAALKALKNKGKSGDQNTCQNANNKY